MTKYTGPIEEVNLVEKVVLTEKQAQEFESFKTLRSSLEEWARDKQDPNAAHSIIHELTFDEMARALYIGYEIEPEETKFQTGDLIIRKDGEIFKSQKLVDAFKYYDGTTEYLVLYTGWKVPINEVRHATPEEIYWLETLNRNLIKDFHIGDIYIDREFRAEILENDRHVQLARIWYDDGDFKGLYPAESFKPFPKEQSNAHHR